MLRKRRQHQFGNYIRRRNSTKKEIREKCIIRFGCELSPDSQKREKNEEEKR